MSELYLEIKGEFKRFTRWERIDKGQRDNLDNLRWRVVTWLVVIELVLGQNLLGQVLIMLQGSRA